MRGAAPRSFVHMIVCSKRAGDGLRNVEYCCGGSGMKVAHDETVACEREGEVVSPFSPSMPSNARVLVLALCALCASAFVLPPAAPAVARSAAAAVASAADIRMDQDDKKAKAAKYKLKSSRSATKRFKVTSTGKLLRHFAGKAHLLRKKRPQRQTKLRRVGSVNDRDLDTYQRLLLVVPKRK